MALPPKVEAARRAAAGAVERFRSSCQGEACDAAAMGLRWPDGARVLDLVTGLEGVIVRGTRRQVQKPPAVSPKSSE